MSDLPKIIVIVGPTAVGKTSLSIELAKQVGGEIVSADSRQVYRGLDLGTGKVTPTEMRGVPHHLLDVAEPSIRFTASDYVEHGRKAIAEILSRGKTPIIVGGTGMYIDALIGRIALANVAPNEELRTKLGAYTTQQLVAELKKLDPETLETIDIQNPRRLMRAIEIAHALGGVPKQKSELLYGVTWIGLTLPMDVLVERIHTRLVDRLAVGMLDEAKKLHAAGLSYERMDELGLEYRYMARHLQGRMTYDEMVETIDLESLKYAKRQMTWFKKNSDINWLDASTPNLLELVLAQY